MSLSKTHLITKYRNWLLRFYVNPKAAEVLRRINAMLYRLIKGTFKPKTGKPDGDSVRFAPDCPALISDLPRKWEQPYVRKGDGTIQIRYEGIDTLELGQKPLEGKTDFAEEAKHKNLKLLGTPDGESEASGYILTNLIDSSGRPIAFVFTGCATENDGTLVSLNVKLMKESINFHMICKGYAYPFFYSTLSDDLRKAIQQETTEARTEGRGLWPYDQTCKEMTVKYTSDSRNPLHGLCPIFPKLWRRLDSYRTDMGFTGGYAAKFTLYCFKDYLEGRGDKVLIISKSKFTYLHKIVKVNVCKNTVKMCHRPEDLIFF